jgi:hypothetical protein
MYIYIYIVISNFYILLYLNICIYIYCHIQFLYTTLSFLVVVVPIYAPCMIYLRTWVMFGVIDVKHSSSGKRKSLET